MKTTVHQQTHLSLRKLITWALYILLPLALLHYYIFLPCPVTDPSPSHLQTSTISTSHARRSRGSSVPQCNYSTGQWVPDKRGPLYTGLSCETIKEGQNCMAHGRPDTGYLYWRWKPLQCSLPPFDPVSFLQLISNKHVAFVGDSMARNQAESLMCLLATGSDPDLVSRDGTESRFRKWIFRSHNATVSIYWSPFLVKTIEKSEESGNRHNRVFLDSFDDRWIADFETMDLIVFSLGHWFLIPGIYHENERIIGCHVCPEFNHTEIGFFDVFRKAVGRTLDEVRRRHVEGSDRRRRMVVVTTFSPAHFEGEWDKSGSCDKKEPYSEEKEMEYTVAEMRRIVLEEMAGVRGKIGTGEKGGVLEMEAIDVTRLALMRPDGHPGPYMYPNPFADGKRERVQNDCVHWCLPGPVDTFNEILLQLMVRSSDL